MRGQAPAFANLGVDVMHTPDRYPGGVCPWVTRGTGSGSCSFATRCLLAQLPRLTCHDGDLATLLASARMVLFAYPDGTAVPSGHGPDTTIGDERRNNPFLQPS